MCLEAVYRAMKDTEASLRRWAPLAAMVFVAVAAVVGGAAIADGPTGEAVLEDVEQRYDEADTVVGSATVVATNGTATETAEVEFATAGEKSRTTVEYDDRTAVLGTNGSVGWVYEPTTGVTRTYDNDTREERMEKKAVELRERYEQNTTAERIGTEAVGGEEAHLIEVTSTNESIDETGKLWVSTEDSKLLKAEATNENGTVTVTFEETEFGASVHESTFEPPSEGGDLIEGADREEFDSLGEAESATEMTVPDLRERYEFEEAVVASYEDETTVTAEYDTDAGTVYVGVTTGDTFGADGADRGETVDVGGKEATAVESQRGSVVYWDDGDETTAVVTRGPRSTALEVARAAAE
jgi:outer membrane lipoprotein-sorting protein